MAVMTEMRKEQKQEEEGPQPAQERKERLSPAGGRIPSAQRSELSACNRAATGDQQSSTPQLCPGPTEELWSLVQGRLQRTAAQPALALARMLAGLPFLVPATPLAAAGWPLRTPKSLIQAIRGNSKNGLNC